jgi:hypothetical protein
MIILTNTTDTLQVILGQAVATNQMQCYVAFRTTTSSAITPASQLSTTNSTTTVNIVSSPGASEQRIIDFISIDNADTAPNDITVRFNDNGTFYTLFKARLNSGDKLEYQDGKGFKVINSSGAIVTNKSIASQVSSLTTKIIYLPNDVTLTSTLLRVTSLNIPTLEFTPIADKEYYYKALVLYDVDATTTGVRFNLASENIGILQSGISIFGITSSTVSAYQANPVVNYAASTSATTPTTTQNLAKIEGVLRAGQNDVIKLTVAHDTGGTLTIKKGSMITFQQVL